MYDYKFVSDIGSITYIPEKSRKAAIRVYCEVHGRSIAWVNDHCTVTCMGRIATWTNLSAKRNYEKISNG